MDLLLEGIQGGCKAGFGQASISTGFIYGSLGSDNGGFSGSFTTGSGSGATFGGYGSFGNGVQVYGGGLGVAFSPFTFSASRSVTSNPLQFGKATGSLAAMPIDAILSLAKQAACK